MVTEKQNQHTDFSRSILIADDDSVTRKLLSKILQNSGFNVEICENGLQAWNVLRQQQIKLAILDWMMPGINGIEICKQLRTEQNSSYVYMIILSIRDSKHDIVEALRAGADDFIVKPFDSDELLSRVQIGERILNLETRLKDKISNLTESQKDVFKRNELIPICTKCKDVRTPQDTWQQFEQYFYDRHNLHFSHCICPDCMKKVVEQQNRQLQRITGKPNQSNIHVVEKKR